LDEALIYQQQTLLSRMTEDPDSALAVDGFNRSRQLTSGSPRLTPMTA
jgi:hypothetical protein